MVEYTIKPLFLDTLCSTRLQLVLISHQGCTAGELGLQLMEEEQAVPKGYEEFGAENLKLAEDWLPLALESWPTWGK